MFTFFTRLRTQHTTGAHQRLRQRQTAYLIDVFQSETALMEFEHALTQYEELLYSAARVDEKEAVLLRLPSYRRNQLEHVPLAQVLSAQGYLQQLDSLISTLEETVNDQQRRRNRMGNTLALLFGLTRPPRTVLTRLTDLKQQLQHEKSIIAFTLAHRLRQWQQGKTEAALFLQHKIVHPNLPVTFPFFESVEGIHQTLKTIKPPAQPIHLDPFLTQTVKAIHTMMAPLVPASEMLTLFGHAHSIFKGRRTRAQLVYTRALFQHQLNKTPELATQLQHCERALLQAGQWLGELNVLFHRHARREVKKWHAELLDHQAHLKQQQLAHASHSLATDPRHSLTTPVSMRVSSLSAPSAVILPQSVTALPTRSEVYAHFRQALRDWIDQLAQHSSVSSHTLPGFYFQRNNLQLLLDYAEEEMEDEKRQSLLKTLQQLLRLITEPARVIQLNLLQTLFAVELSYAQKQRAIEQGFTRLSALQLAHTPAQSIASRTPTFTPRASTFSLQPTHHV